MVISLQTELAVESCSEVIISGFGGLVSCGGSGGVVECRSGLVISVSCWFEGEVLLLNRLAVENGSGVVISVSFWLNGKG